MEESEQKEEITVENSDFEKTLETIKVLREAKEAQKDIAEIQALTERLHTLQTKLDLLQSNIRENKMFSRLQLLDGLTKIVKEAGNEHTNEQRALKARILAHCNAMLDDEFGVVQTKSV